MRVCTVTNQEQLNHAEHAEETSDIVIIGGGDYTLHPGDVHLLAVSGIDVIVNLTIASDAIAYLVYEGITTRGSIHVEANARCFIAAVRYAQVIVDAPHSDSEVSSRTSSGGIVLVSHGSALEVFGTAELLRLLGEQE